jgi:hypothetical protein
MQSGPARVVRGGSCTTEPLYGASKHGSAEP